jgi:pimeloyl-ACP methyl ester carboxylesterase
MRSFVRYLVAVVASGMLGGMAVAEVYDLGDAALFVPAGVQHPRAVLIALGGPNTRAFVTGEPAAPMAPPPLEEALQSLGQSFRELAAEHGLALLAFPTAAVVPIPNGAASDQRIRDALVAAAEASGRPSMTSVPILMWAGSGGAPQAAGFTARHPDRVVGLFLKVPPPELTLLTEPTQRAVPTYLVLAGEEALFDNADLVTAFSANRARGGLWSLAVEPGVLHHSLSPTQHRVTVAWLETVLNLRMKDDAGPLLAIDEESGWLGDNDTGEVASWSDYGGDRTAASWFPTADVARQWQPLVGADGAR